MANVIGITLNICRLCLKAIQDLEIIKDSEKEIIHIIVPQIDLHISDNPMICKDCTKLLQQSFAFKSKCLEIEDSIHDYKQDGTDKVNLEKILGIVDDSATKCIKICRTCLGYLENNAFIEPTKENGILLMIDKCLPEMDINLTRNPVICQLCQEILKEIFNFVTLCIKNEERIKSSNTNDAIGEYKLNIEFALERTPTENENYVTISQVQNSSVHSDDGDNVVYIVSDNDITTDNSDVSFTCSIRKKRPPTSVITDNDAASDQDSDYKADTSLSCASDEETFPSPVKKKPRVNTLKTPSTVTPSSVRSSIFCKYCYFVTTCDATAKRHIYFCPRSPHLTDVSKLPDQEKPKSFATVLDDTDVSPMNDRAVSPVNDTALSTMNDTALSPMNNTAVSPVNNTAVSPRNNKAVSPTDNTAVSAVDDKLQENMKWRITKFMEKGCSSSDNTLSSEITDSADKTKAITDTAMQEALSNEATENSDPISDSVEILELQNITPVSDINTGNNSSDLRCDDLSGRQVIINNLKGIFTVVSGSDIEGLRLENNFPYINTNNENEVHIISTANNGDEIHIISDSEEETVDETTDINTQKRLTPVTSAEVLSAIVVEHNTIETAILGDVSDEELCSFNLKDPTETMEKEAPLLKSIICKYCDFITKSDLAAKEHISSCVHNTSPEQIRRKINPLAKNLFAILSKHPEEIAEIRNKKNLIRETAETKKNVKSRKATGDMEKETMAIEAMENSDDSFIKETEALAGSETVSMLNRSLKGKKINYLEMTDETDNEETNEKEEVEAAITNNKKKLFTELTILACNHCRFNSRSSLKMSIHCSSHSTNNEKIVNYGIGYRTLFYCVKCAKCFRTASSLHSHADVCAENVDSKVFLFMVGKVMHCIKCYFDSDDRKLVMKHLLNCGSIKIDDGD